jgi:hypothetical protein
MVQELQYGVLNAYDIKEHITSFVPEDLNDIYHRIFERDIYRESNRRRYARFDLMPSSFSSMCTNISFLVSSFPS